MGKSRSLETILNKVTISKLIRFAGIALSYWLPHFYNQVVKWLESCVKGFNQKNTYTALQKEVLERKNLNLKDLKTGKI